jgi:hypothetical protein
VHGVVGVAVVVVRVLVGELSHRPLPETQAAGTRTRGSPEVIEMEIAPLDPT